MSQRHFAKGDPERDSDLYTVTQQLGRGVAFVVQTETDRQTSGKGHMIGGKWHDPKYEVQMSESLRGVGYSMKQQRLSAAGAVAVPGGEPRAFWESGRVLLLDLVPMTWVFGLRKSTEDLCVGRILIKS